MAFSICVSGVFVVKAKLNFESKLRVISKIVYEKERCLLSFRLAVNSPVIPQVIFQAEAAEPTPKETEKGREAQLANC